MPMYENIVKSLRHCAENDCSPECPRAGIGKGCISGLKREAADAIEELQKLIDGVSADNDSLCGKIAELRKTLETVQDAHNEGYDVEYLAGRRDYEPPKVET